MRFIIWDDRPEFWIGLAIMAVLMIGIVLYHWLRPPLWQKLLADSRYQQALRIYAGNLPGAEATGDDRQQARAVAVEYLAKEHGIPAEEAGPNFRLVAARFDRDQSYELRQEAVFYEQAGAYELALDYYERAAGWQVEHDPKDYQFLQQCVARVRRKVRPR